MTIKNEAVVTFGLAFAVAVEDLLDELKESTVIDFLRGPRNFYWTETLLAWLIVVIGAPLALGLTAWLTVNPPNPALNERLAACLIVGAAIGVLFSIAIVGSAYDRWQQSAT